MTIEDVKKEVAAIEALSDDDEVAHNREDSLHRDVLRAIAEGADHPAALAVEALKTRNIDFARWCA